VVRPGKRSVENVREPDGANHRRRPGGL
jgi:hypothetical protein